MISSLLSQLAIAAVLSGTPSENRADYKRAYEKARKEKVALYYSYGEPGSPLPEGRYRLFWAKGPDGEWDVYYEKQRLIVPKPDKE